MATMMQHFVSSPTEDNKLACELALQSGSSSMWCVSSKPRGNTRAAFVQCHQFPACERSIWNKQNHLFKIITLLHYFLNPLTAAHSLIISQEESWSCFLEKTVLWDAKTYSIPRFIYSTIYWQNNNKILICGMYELIIMLKQIIIYSIPNRTMLLRADDFEFTFRERLKRLSVCIKTFRKLELHLEFVYINIVFCL